MDIFEVMGAPVRTNKKCVTKMAGARLSEKIDLLSLSSLAKKESTRSETKV